MRSFSAELTAIMQAITVGVADLSGDVALLCKSARAQHKLRAARQGIAGRHQNLLRQSIALADARGIATSRGLQDQSRRLGRRIHKSLTICNAGRNLARCALIEAAHSQVMAKDLQKVADELGNAVNRIIRILKTMHAELLEIAP